jgi:hypothetical protein
MAALPRTLVPVIERLARSRALLGFDFDGTLAPIIGDRTAGRMRAVTRALLGRVCSLYRCAIISGRGLGDLRGRLAGVRPSYLFGNHGIDPSPRKERFRRCKRGPTSTSRTSCIRCRCTIAIAAGRPAHGGPSTARSRRWVCRCASSGASKWSM